MSSCIVDSGLGTVTVWDGGGLHSSRNSLQTEESTSVSVADVAAAVAGGRTDHHQLKPVIFRARTCQPLGIKIKSFFYYQNIEGEFTTVKVRKIVCCTAAVIFFMVNLLLPVINPFLTFVAAAVLSVALSASCYATAAFNFFDDNSRTSENRLLLQDIFKEHIGHNMPPELFHRSRTDPEVQAWFNRYYLTDDYKSWAFVYEQAGSFSFMRNQRQVMDSGYVQESIRQLRDYFLAEAKNGPATEELQPNSYALISRLEKHQHAECDDLAKKLEQMTISTQKMREALLEKENISNRSVLEKLSMFNESERCLKHMREDKYGLLTQLRNSKPDAFLYIKNMLASMEQENNDGQKECKKLAAFSAETLHSVGRSLLVSEHHAKEMHLSERVRHNSHPHPTAQPRWIKI